MCSHCNCREQKACSMLDLQPADCICIIAGPCLWHVIKHSCIESATSTGTTFKQYLWKSFCQCLHYPVKSKYIAVRQFILIFSVKISASKIRQMPVHIPFHITDISRYQHLTDCFDQIFANCRIRQIQYQLMSAEYWFVERTSDHPVWMLPVKVTFP